MTQSSAAKLIHLIRPKDGKLSPLENVFMEYESELCDLLRAVDLAGLAKDADEDGTIEAGHTVLPIALDGLRDRAAKLKAKWYEDHRRIFKQQS
jgi:hypothetical protein